MANLIRGLSENGGVVFCGVDSTDIVRKQKSFTPQAPPAARHLAVCSPVLP